MTDEYQENLNRIVEALFIQTQELSEEAQEIRRNVDDMIKRTDVVIKESQEYREKLVESNREKIFELTDIEIRRLYKKSSSSISPEKHEVFMRLLEHNHREENAFINTHELIKKYKKLKKLNDLEHKYDENHKFLVIFDRVVDKVLQGYIVQFICFLITGESYGRYEGYWNKSPATELSVNDIEDIGKNHGEKLEVNIPLVINDIKKSITNTLCFFSQLNEPEKNEVSPSPAEQMKIN